MIIMKLSVEGYIKDEILAAPSKELHNKKTTSNITRNAIYKVLYIFKTII